MILQLPLNGDHLIVVRRAQLEPELFGQPDHRVIDAQYLAHHLFGAPALAVADHFVEQDAPQPLPL